MQTNRVNVRTNAVRAAWEARGGTAVAVAKDPGINHYGYGTTHPEVSRLIEPRRVPTQRMCITGGSQTGQCNIIGANMFWKCLYGSECH